MSRKNYQKTNARVQNDGSWGALLASDISKEEKTAYDYFVNPLLGLGHGGGNASSADYYINSINKNFDWLQLRAMYTSNWLARRMVEIVAEDMTREGVEISSSIEPDKIKEMQAEISNLGIFNTLFHTICMARVYGGAIAYIDIEGQLPSTPLDVKTIRKGQFKGLKMFDRWQLLPSFDDFDPMDNKPNYYTVLTPYDVTMQFSKPSDLEKLKEFQTDVVIHRSRVVRIDGDFLSYIDFLQNQRWYGSVLVSLLDLINAYMKATAALDAAAYKACFRYVKVSKMFQILNQGPQGQSGKNLMAFISAMRMAESTENITVLDKEDEIGVINYDLSGIMSAIEKKEKQLATASGIPQMKLFGEHVKGLNATADNEIRMFYDKIKSNQEKMRPDILKVLEIVYCSVFGSIPPEDFNFEFVALWQLDPNEKAQINKENTDSVVEAVQAGVVSKSTGLKELLQSAETTGFWSNITDDDIEAAEEEEEEPPQPDENNELMQNFMNSKNNVIGTENGENTGVAVPKVPGANLRAAA